MKITFIYILFTLLPILTTAQTRIKSFYFETDRSVPTPYSQNQLAIFKKSLQRGEFIVFEIYSYTDSVGTNQYNDSLAKKRLQYVSTFLGVSNNPKVVLKPYGMVRNYDVKDYKSWRRVDIYYGNSNKIITPDSIIHEKHPDSLAEYPKITPIIPELKSTDPIELSIQNSLPYILNIGFIEGRSKIDKNSMDAITTLYLYLSDHPDMNILIRGHVCCGNNMRISRNRAKAVYKELVKMGIDPNRLSYVGLSNNEPLVYPEKTNEDRQKNRRVDVKFMQVDL